MSVTILCEFRGIPINVDTLNSPFFQAMPAFRQQWSRGVLHVVSARRLRRAGRLVRQSLAVKRP
jgi:hypothetical protein